MTDETINLHGYNLHPDSPEVQEQTKTDLLRAGGGVQAVKAYLAEQNRIKVTTLVSQSLRRGLPVSEITARISWERLEELAPEVATELKVLELRESMNKEEQ